MKQRVTSSIKETDGLWSYAVTVDGAEVASGSGYVSVSTMQVHLDRDTMAAKRNLEADEAAKRFTAELRPAVLLLAPSLELATAARELVRVLLHLPVHVEVAPLAPFGEVPEGLRPIGFCSLGVDFGDEGVHRWTLDNLVPLFGRGAVFMGVESDVSDIVPVSARHVFPFLS